MELKIFGTTGLAISLSLTLLNFISGTASAQTSMGQSEGIGQNAKIYNAFSTRDDSPNKMKKSLKVSFIDDSHANKKIAIISTEGSYIDAAKRIEDKEVDGQVNGYMSALLQWPSSYHIGMELYGKSSSFHKVAPINTVDTKKIFSTVGYNVGGTVKIAANEKGPNGEGSITGGTSWSTTTSYDQTDYKTILALDTSKKVQWEILFVSAMNQGYGPYNRDSDDSIYRNQLFMQSRNATVWAKENFISKDQMPALAAYGFSPGVLAVVTADKSEKYSDLTVTFERISDNYWMNWKSFFNGWQGSGTGWWTGTNIKEQRKASSSSKYILDWENHNLIEK